MDVDCGYCDDRIGTDDFLECEECEQYVHVRCLRRPGTPGDFVGDIFFKFTCVSCTNNAKETFEREKLPWTMIIVLTIYNLTKKSQGLSRNGYFHWRSHIAHFIDKNWAYLVEPNFKKKKNWIGTITGTLSHHSPVLFTSGLAVFNEGGYWKLSHNKTPKQYYDFVKRFRKDKGATEEINVLNDEPRSSLLGKRAHESSADESESETDTEPDHCSRTLPFTGKYKWDLKLKDEPEPMIDILNFIDSSENSNLLDEMPALPTLTSEEINSVIPSFTTGNYNDLLDNLFDCKPKIELPFEEDEFSEPKILQVNNYQENIECISHDPDIKQELPSDVEMQDDEDEMELPYEEKYICEKSLFTSKPPPEKYPWEIDFAADQDDNDNFIGDKCIELMGEYEENEIFKRLKAIFEAEKSRSIDIPPWIRRHYRKLCVRKMQRSLGLSVFNVDKFNKRSVQTSKQTTQPAVLDRFHHLIAGSGDFSLGKRTDNTFMARLAGSCTYDLFISPHTERILHPFIYRNDSCVPPWVKLLCELQYEVNGTMPSRASIDFCYVRPQHIAAVNGLLQRMFWPGIDMSECLSYPDFSVVALYKKLVIGCAFLVPDVGHNEAYVSFMAVRPGWQRAGIATFMLYHLTQTCMGKDFTLHVSANNPAICLYQRFGFKIQELILDFYDKYLPYDSTQSRHAFFLRLER
ncbi:cysteine-rich protein 2-binding protein [Contarinia nasturtii]|uniref:cysteine-rich protein 2-binding protein n=1 Tax=Contarinia nasturtii TaxID=265458 RepID=UPI0012D45EFF|nr:cysteine-rich protein 2-binding protein [Contarinia nasturtii]